MLGGVEGLPYEGATLKADSVGSRSTAPLGMVASVPMEMVASAPAVRAFLWALV